MTFPGARRTPSWVAAASTCRWRLWEPQPAPGFPRGSWSCTCCQALCPPGRRGLLLALRTSVLGLCHLHRGDEPIISTLGELIAHFPGSLWAIKISGPFYFLSREKLARRMGGAFIFLSG